MSNYEKIKDIIKLLTEEQLEWVFGFLYTLYFIDDEQEGGAA